MGKAINGIVNRSEEAHDERNVIRLEVIDFLHPKGSRIKAVIKDRKKEPHVMVTLAVRTVTYLYDNDRVSKGFEIVDEQLMTIKDAEARAYLPVEVVGEITRDLRTPADQLNPKRFED